MIPHVALFQPRNGTPSWPTDPQPADPDAGAAAPTPTPSPTPVTNTGTTTVTTNTGSTYLTQEQCELADKNGLIAAGGYAFGSSLLGILLFMVMRKKLWGTAFSRYAISILGAAILSVVLVGWDPIRADVLTRCLDPNQGFTQYVTLGSMVIARTLVLGLMPTVVLTLTGCFVANRT